MKIIKILLSTSKKNSIHRGQFFTHVQVHGMFYTNHVKCRMEQQVYNAFLLFLRIIFLISLYFTTLVSTHLPTIHDCVCMYVYYSVNYIVGFDIEWILLTWNFQVQQKLFQKFSTCQDLPPINYTDLKYFVYFLFE